MESTRIYEEIESLLKETGREIKDGPKINEEPGKGKRWMLVANQGAVKFEIQHPLDKSYILVTSGFELTKDGVENLQKLFLKSNDVIDFNYALVSAISSPHVYSSFRKAPIYKSDNIYKGFDVVARIFPFEKFYSIDRLEDAIQNVVNVAMLGPG
jgi:hypothetical protein